MIATLDKYAAAMGVSRSAAIRSIFEAQQPIIEQVTDALQHVRSADRSSARAAVNKLVDTMLQQTRDGVVEAADVINALKPVARK